MIKVEAKGNFDKTEKFLKKMSKREVRSTLNKYGERGVALLSQATPVRSGRTASSWSFKINSSGGRYEIIWSNSNVNRGVNIAMIIQYGHGTRNGGYVQGIDYINPVTAQVFEEMANELWREVTSA